MGFWVGPLYIVHNLEEYIIATFDFVRSEKRLRKGLLRLCVAAGIAWIGWISYESLNLSGIVWLILIVPIGEILLAWVISGFQKSATRSE